MEQPRDAKGRFLSKKQQLPTPPEQAPGIMGLKGFNRNFACLGQQYEEGQRYHVAGRIQFCRRGMHFCTDPLGVFSYYPPNDSRYAVVVGSGKIDSSAHKKSLKVIADDTKHAASDLYVVKELSLDKLVSAVVYNASKSVVEDHKGKIEETEYPWDIKYRIVSVQQTKAILTTDTQDILSIGQVMINDNTRGYAGPLYDTNLCATLSVVTSKRSIAYGRVALSLSACSIAKGKFASMALGDSSVAHARSIAVATGCGSVAVSTGDHACCICKSGGKVIMYGAYSVGILGAGSSDAEVYGSYCTLVLSSYPPDRIGQFLLKDGTTILWHDNDGSLLVIIAGVDIKSSDIKNGVPKYTGEQITDALLSKAPKNPKN